jgi:thioredoxin-like negative regulator of GroEL
MKKQIRTTLPTAILFIFTIFTSCTGPAKNNDSNKISSDSIKRYSDINKMNRIEFKDYVKDKNFCVLFFTMKKCVPCIPAYKALNKLSADYSFKLIKVDSDSNAVLTENYKVEMFPWIVCYSKGEEIYQSNHYDESKLKMLIDKHHRR